MSGLLAVLPVIDTEYTETCIDSMQRSDSAFGVAAEDVLLIDNTRNGDLWNPTRSGRDVFHRGMRVHRDIDGHNLGVARAWNVGAREVLERGLDYLVIMSASMLFGPDMHTTWLRQMTTFWGSDLIESEGNSWHLIAIHRSCFERVGLFDENFYPAYEESIDWGYRAMQVGIVHWPRAWVNAMSQGTGMALPLVSCPWGPLRDYYVSKWGGVKGEEKWVLPFGDKPLDYWEEVAIPDLAAKYELVKWW